MACNAIMKRNYIWRDVGGARIYALLRSVQQLCAKEIGRRVVCNELGSFRSDVDNSFLNLQAYGEMH